MSKSRPSSDSTLISKVTPTDQHVSSLLKRIQPSEKSKQFIFGQWQTLSIKHPEITHFISATSYQMAPNEPETREAITTSMLALYVLMDEAFLQKDVERVFKDALLQHFPDTDS